MLCTFGQAKKQLARFAGAYELNDIGAAVNAAVDELAASKNWQLMRKVRRFTLTGEQFAVTQDIASIMRVSIDGVPVSLRGSDYEFLQSGPGSMDDIPAGYAPANGVLDLGNHATMYDLPQGYGLVCFGTETAPVGDIVVTGRTESGDTVTGVVPYQQWTAATDIDAPGFLTVTPLAGIAYVDRVVLPSDAAAYISMYGVLEGVYSFVSRMHPTIRIPEFRRYRLPGYGTGSYRLLAEVRLRSLPFVADDDVLPFESLLPVQYMLMSMADMNAKELKSASEYRQAAVGLLAQREETSQERQGLVVINSLYDDSIGRRSVNYFNC